MIEALDIQVKGIVQGVGFRPFVYRLAKRYLINGWVLNAVDGVFIHAEGEEKLLDEFVMELHMNPPAAAQVDEVDLKEVPLQDFTTFEIRFSDEAAAQETTLVSPDLATCDDCVAELFDPADRRYRYPFINCTNCGPRFTIIDELPYDRAKTSMREFPMCPACAHEYKDPEDRRFHAQPDACFECGPSLSWDLLTDGAFDNSAKVASADGAAEASADGADASSSDAVAALLAANALASGETFWASNRTESDAVLAAGVRVLRQGGIVAVKGLGGFHLACDANNAQAVAELRKRKRREGKAFAVMMANVEDVQQVCQVSAEEQKVLTSAAHPIVLLKVRESASFATGLIDGLDELGVMLPYTPVQHLLLHDFAEAEAAATLASESKAGGVSANPPMLVMTSGNLHDEPIVIDDGEARAKFVGIADAMIGNNRAIRTRFDDSVVRVLRAGEQETAIQLIRRARGYCPVPLPAPAPVQSGAVRADDCLFCAGPEQKNTFALVRASAQSDQPASEAFVSQHIGDLETMETYDAWLQAKDRFQGLFNMQPTVIAADLHPEYLSTKWAVRQHDENGTAVIQTQHHHAHIASVLGEHGITDAVCGIAFDGTGYGMDGAIWGGEVLLANMAAFERFANFAYVPMPGGAAAVKQPLRMAYGVLWAFDLLEHEGAQALLAKLGDQANVCEEMIEKGLNTPNTSSAGRLFDAASAILGLCDQARYEGEPAIVLGAAVDADAEADPQAAERYAVVFVKNTATEASTAQDTSVLLMDAEPTFRALLDDVVAGVPVPIIARRFHDAFAGAVLMAAEFIRVAYGISTVALSGGVFMNRYLTEQCLVRLQDAGFQAAINRDLPPNDGCISFGQAVIALSTEQD